MLFLPYFSPVFDDSEAVLDPLRQASEEFEVLEVSYFQAQNFQNPKPLKR